MRIDHLRRHLFLWLALFLTLPAAAQVRVSQFPAATSVPDTDILWVDRDPYSPGSTRKAPASLLFGSALTTARTLTDPNADRILFWDDSAGRFEWLSLDTGLSTPGTTLNLDLFTSGTKGAVPASGGGTNNFLRADGTWAAPPGSGGGGGTPGGSNTQVQYNNSGAFGGSSTGTFDGTKWTFNNLSVPYTSERNITNATGGAITFDLRGAPVLQTTNSSNQTITLSSPLGSQHSAWLIRLTGNGVNTFALAASGGFTLSARWGTFNSTPPIGLTEYYLEQSGSTIYYDTIARSVLADLPVITASRLLGRGSAAGDGTPVEITLGSGLLMSGTTLSSTASGGTTINPADGYLPYRSNGTTFADSPWYRISTNRLGYNSTNWFVFSDPANLNLGLGDGAFRQVTSGGGNSSYGQSTLTNLSSGNNNNAFGFNALGSLSTGTDNDGFGLNALRSVVSGQFNAGFGGGSLYNTTGSQNSALGNQSGLTNISGAGNVFLGYNANPPTPTNSNSIVLGANAVGKGNNTAVIGDGNVSALWLAGTVGWYRGNGSPEGAVTANIGSFYSREDGGTGTSLYRKESGSGNTGWVATTTGGGGDFAGPASSTDNAIVRFDGATGKLGQNSGVIIDDSNNVTGIAAATAATLDTGQGANELYGMDQNVLTTSSPQFVRVTLNGATAANPSVKRDTDTDTGLYWPGSDQVGFAVGGKQGLITRFRSINGDDNILASLGTGAAVTNDTANTFTATIAGPSLNQSANSQYIFLNIGSIGITATDTVTKTGQQCLMEFDKLVFGQSGGAVTYSKVANSRFRFHVPTTGVTLTESVGIDFVLPNASDATGSIGTYKCINIPTMSLSSGTNFQGIYFNNTPNGGSIASAASTHIALMPGSGGNVGIGTTSPAQAFDVVGTVKNSGGIIQSITTTAKTSGYTLTSSDLAVTGDTSGGGFSLTLPASPNSGQLYRIKKVSTDANVLTVAGNGKNVDGAANYTLVSPYASITIQYDGTAWWIF